MSTTLPSRSLPVGRWLLLTFTLGCQVVLPTAPRDPPSTTAEPTSPPNPRAYLALGLFEPLARLGPWSGSSRDTGVQAMELWHSTLATLDDRGVPVARLAAGLPSLDDGSWRVAADGTMSTTYHLRSDVLWHDGVPFTSDDVVFGFEVSRRLRDGPPVGTLFDAITSVEASDRSTVLVHWSRLHPGANAVREELAPVPRRLLAELALSRSDLLSHPYWTESYVGLGPFRVDAFVPGSRIELRAFERYFLARPVLDRVVVELTSSRSELLEGLRDGLVDVVLGDSWGASEAIDTRAVWAPTRGGVVIIIPRAVTLAGLRPARSNAGPASTLMWRNSQEIFNATFRRALAVAINREQTNFAESLGLLPPPITWVPPGDPRWDEARHAVVDDLAYDPARAFRLLDEVGWRRSHDGRLVNLDGQSLWFELRSDDADAVQPVVARYWSEIGAQLDLTRGRLAERPNVFPRDSRATVELFAAPLDEGITASLRADPYLSPYDPTSVSDGPGRDYPYMGIQERLSVERDLVRLATRDVDVLALGFRVQSVPVARGVTGLLPRTGLDLRPWIAFNAHEWSRD